MGVAVPSLLNLGCGPIQPDGWDNADVTHRYGQPFFFDVRSTANWRGVLGWRRDHSTERVVGGEHWKPDWLGEARTDYDGILCDHLLSCFSHDDLRDRVLPNLWRLLRPGGVLRILVPDAARAVDAFILNDVDHFPLGDDLPTIDERFCTFLPWFGESLSIFTGPYLRTLLTAAGFEVLAPDAPSPLPELAAIDQTDRYPMALIVEAVRPR